MQVPLSKKECQFSSGFGKVSPIVSILKKEIAKLSRRISICSFFIFETLLCSPPGTFAVIYVYFYHSLCKIYNPQCMNTLKKIWHFVSVQTFLYLYPPSISVKVLFIFDYKLVYPPKVLYSLNKISMKVKFSFFTQ